MDFDNSQKEVISAYGGYHLVLAAPGCGKTELLTHRIIHAHTAHGVDYSDMLCLTFTNRAARGMRDRIKQNAPESVDELYVGNIHKFCSRFLYDNQIIPMSTGIIDELDQKDILDEFGFTKYNENTTDISERLQVNDIGRLAARKYQEEHNHPKELWLDLPDWIDEEQRKIILQEITNKSNEGPLVIKKDKSEYAIELAQLYYTITFFAILFLIL